MSHPGQFCVQKGSTIPRPHLHAAQLLSYHHLLHTCMAHRLLEVILHTQQHRMTSNSRKLNTVLCVAFHSETAMDPGESQGSSGDNVELNCETPSLTQQFNGHLNQRSLLDLKGQEEKMEKKRRQNVQLIK